MCLHGKIYIAEKMYHCDLSELNQFTWDPTLDGVILDAMRLVSDYFQACRERGTLDSEFARLGVATTLEELQFDVRFDVSQVFGAAKAEFALAS